MPPDDATPDGLALLDERLGLDLHRTSTVDQVADTLRTAILEGRLPPGEPLRESALTELLGVSRGPVREALRLLASEGLVRHQPNRGAAVASLDEHEVADLYRARLVVEMAAAEVVAGDPPLLLGCRTAVGEMRAAGDARDVSRFVAAHGRFHAALVEVLASKRLARFHAGIHAELRLSFAVIDRLTGDFDDVLADHEALLEVLSSGDADAARTAIADHLRHGAADVENLPLLLGD